MYGRLVALDKTDDSPKTVNELAVTFLISVAFLQFVVMGKLNEPFCKSVRIIIITHSKEQCQGSASYKINTNDLSPFIN